MLVPLNGVLDGNDLCLPEGRHGGTTALAD